MHLAVNARLLQRNKLEGIGTFMDEVLKRITKNHPEITFHFIFDRPFDPTFIYQKNVVAHVLYPPTRHALIYDFWFNFRLPSLLKKIKAKAFLSLDSLTSTQLSIPQHLVIHDINFYHRPQDLPSFIRKYYLNKMPRFAQTANQIATVSEYSKKDLCETYGVKSEKIDVVYNAAKSVFTPTDENEKAAIKQKYSDGAPYFFYVGSLHPRKNLLRLMQAFELFKEKDQGSTKLLIAGNIMWSFPEFKTQLEKMKFRNEVVLLGRIDDQTLANVLSSALALTYVPFFEGFGIPIIEGYASKVPVITSNTTCLPEIAEDGALLVNPNSTEEICSAMTLLAENEAKRNELAERGFEIQQKYSWDHTANLYWNSVEKIL